MARTELFYRLMSQAVGNYYLQTKEDRHREIKKLLRESTAFEKNIQQDLRWVENSLPEFEQLLSNQTAPKTERAELAEKYKVIREHLLESIEQQTEKIAYKDLSKDEFVKWMRSDLTAIFKVTFFLEECRGRLLDYLMQRT